MRSTFLLLEFFTCKPIFLSSLRKIQSYYLCSINFKVLYLYQYIPQYISSIINSITGSLLSTKYVRITSNFHSLMLIIEPKHIYLFIYIRGRRLTHLTNLLWKNVAYFNSIEYPGNFFTLSICVIIFINTYFHLIFISWLTVPPPFSHASEVSLILRMSLFGPCVRSSVCIFYSMGFPVPSNSQKKTILPRSARLKRSPL